MAKEQVAGAIVLDTLRERIVSGLYVGHWRPGDRLPSIREIAEAENVDRKTAAAAYHRLEEEGLVKVRPRSGVYLCAPPPPAPPGPLERLHRQWLQHTFAGARALGLDTPTILRLVGAVSELEQLRLPVIECNWPQAEAIAAELRERLSVQAMPYLLEEVRPGDPMLGEGPVLVTTPYHSAEVALLAPGRVIIEATLAPGILRELHEHALREQVLVVAGDDRQADKVRRALRLRSIAAADRPIAVAAASDRDTLLAATGDAARAFIWPGTPAWVDEAVGARLACTRPRRFIAEDAIGRIQTALLDTALRRAREPSRSIDAATPR